MNRDPIIAADRAEEQSAATELRRARNGAELLSAWNLNAEHFGGEARERLQDVFAEKLRALGALAP